MPSAKALEIRKRLLAGDSAVAELERCAGIADEARRAREGLPALLPIGSVAQICRERWRRDIETYREASQQYEREGLRRAYFSVQDIELRSQLIAKDREQAKLSLDFFQQEVDDYKADLESARASGSSGWLSASMAGAVCVGIGFSAFGMPGALGGALIGFFFGRHLEQSSKRARDHAIATAENDAKEAEKTLAEITNEQETFSLREERSGEPEQCNG